LVYCPSSNVHVHCFVLLSVWWW